jgi:dynein heavy chain 1, cytosolic
LQSKIVAEDKAVETRTVDFLNDWEKNKPTGGRTRPDDALQQLHIFETKFSRLKEEREKCREGKGSFETSRIGDSQ